MKDEAYWQATRAQLQAAQTRADVFTLLGLLAVGIFIWFNHEPGEPLSLWTSLTLALAVIGVPLWFVTRRKRRISAARGLTCRHCGHAPHDTEISEIVQTRQCQSCGKPID